MICFYEKYVAVYSSQFTSFWHWFSANETNHLFWTWLGKKLRKVEKYFIIIQAWNFTPFSFFFPLCTSYHKIQLCNKNLYRKNTLVGWLYQGRKIELFCSTKRCIYSYGSNISYVLLNVIWKKWFVSLIVRTFVYQSTVVFIDLDGKNYYK